MKLLLNIESTALTKRQNPRLETINRYKTIRSTEKRWETSKMKSQTLAFNCKTQSKLSNTITYISLIALRSNI